MKKRKKLFLHSSFVGSGECHLQHMLYSNNVMLQYNGFFYTQTCFERKSHSFSHQIPINQFLQSLNCPQAAEKYTDVITSWFSRLDADAKNADTILLSFHPKDVLNAIISLYKEIKKYKNLSSMELYIVICIGRQDRIFDYCCRKEISNDRIIDIFHSIKKNFTDYNYIISELFAFLGKENVIIIPYDISHKISYENFVREYSKFQSLFLTACDIPINGGQAKDFSLLYMSSPLSVLFWRMAVSIPHNNAYNPPDKETLYRALCRVEKAIQLEPGWISPPDMRQRLLDLSQKGNADTARLLNRIALFSTPNFPTSDCWRYPVLSADVAIEIIRTLPEPLRMQWSIYCRTEAPLLNDEQQDWTALWECAEKKSLIAKAVVSILSLVHNHGLFIARNIESVLCQQVDFPIEHIIVDDCSTDDTRKIIATYAEKYTHIKPFFLQRKSRHGENVEALFSRCRSPYVALCDGDDYFTDPNKLQTQVDFMEAHPECGLCFHPVKVVYEDGSGRERIYPPLEEMPRGVRDFYYLADLMRVNFIQTNSAMYRWRFTEGLPDWFVPDLVPGDWYWHLLHAEMGKIGFINKIMSVYRRHRASLFYASEISPKANRLRHGLSELRSYDVINKHFKGRYAKVLQPLANNVFSNFLEHYMETDDNGLLTTASERFPELAKDFFAEVKVVRVPGGRS